MASKKARSLAAKRGWATRRAAAKERSDRAKRGWATRRAAAKERSDRAKRGWKTRRKNEKLREKEKDGKRQRRRIESIAQWNALDFSDTEEIEIVSNADY